MEGWGLTQACAPRNTRLYYALVMEHMFTPCEDVMDSWFKQVVVHVSLNNGTWGIITLSYCIKLASLKPSEMC